MECNEYLKFWSLKKIDPITVAYSGVFRRRYTGFDTKVPKLKKHQFFHQIFNANVSACSFTVTLNIKQHFLNSIFYFFWTNGVYKVTLGQGTAITMPNVLGNQWENCPCNKKKKSHLFDLKVGELINSIFLFIVNEQMGFQPEWRLSW